jgi:hypothetical protein
MSENAAVFLTRPPKYFFRKLVRSLGYSSLIKLPVIAGNSRRTLDDFCSGGSIMNLTTSTKLKIAGIGPLGFMATMLTGEQSSSGWRLPVAFAVENQFDHTHQDWTSFLHKFVIVKVHESAVAYGRVKTDKGQLEGYLALLQKVSKSEFDRFSENQKLAFLINAYNAFTIKLIVDHYPVSSIKDTGSLLKSPWKIEFFTLFGEEKHLDNIEHDMVRKWFQEPRIHFALVCASKGCPALHNEAFTADRFELQLEEGAKNFLTDAAKNRYSPETRKLELSSIFKWYGDDFVKKYGSVEAFVAPRISENPDSQRIIREKKAMLTFLDYDWSLNDSK